MAETWYCVVEIEPIVPGEPSGSPTIVEVWGPFVGDDEATEWADNMAAAHVEHWDPKHGPRHTFMITDMRGPVKPRELMGDA